MNLHFRFAQNRARRTLLYLHGFMGQSDDWLQVAERLGSKFNHLFIDLPGHGKSLLKEDETPSAETFFAALQDVLQTVKVSRVTVIGYSMGGRLAMQWLVQSPQKIEAMVLESAHPGLITAEKRQRRRQADRDLSMRLSEADFDFRAFLRDWYAMPLFGNLQKNPQFARLLERRLQNDPRQLAGALTGFSVARQPSLWNRLAKWDLPVLLICGESDQKYADVSARMQATNPNFKRVVAPGCGHNVHFENPEWMAREVEGFLERS